VHGVEFIARVLVFDDAFTAPSDLPIPRHLLDHRRGGTLTAGTMVLSDEQFSSIDELGSRLAPPSKCG
jgi:hypothetical protein